MKELSNKLTLISLLFSIAFLLSATYPVLADIPSDFVLPSDIAISHRPPPNHILSPDLTDDNSQNPEPDLGNPNYWDYSVFKLIQGGSYIGSYGQFSPEPLVFETDWWSHTPEYWIQTVVQYEYHFLKLHPTHV